MSETQTQIDQGKPTKRKACRWIRRKLTRRPAASPKKESKTNAGKKGNRKQIGVANPPPSTSDIENQSTLLSMRFRLNALDLHNILVIYY